MQQGSIAEYPSKKLEEYLYTVSVFMSNECSHRCKKLQLHAIDMLHATLHAIDMLQHAACSALYAVAALQWAACSAAYN